MTQEATLNTNIQMSCRSALVVMESCSLEFCGPATSCLRFSTTPMRSMTFLRGSRSSSTFGLGCLAWPSQQTPRNFARFTFRRRSERKDLTRMLSFLRLRDLTHEVHGAQPIAQADARAIALPPTSSGLLGGVGGSESNANGGAGELESIKGVSPEYAAT